MAFAPRREHSFPYHAHFLFAIVTGRVQRPVHTTRDSLYAQVNTGYAKGASDDVPMVVIVVPKDEAEAVDQMTPGRDAKPDICGALPSGIGLEAIEPKKTGTQPASGGGTLALESKSRRPLHTAEGDQHHEYAEHKAFPV
jgi:hypothetical protein